MMMVMMESIAVMPIPVMSPAVVCVPPTRVITPVPRTMPCVPSVAPEPVVDYRSVDIYRFDDIVFAIDIFITYNLDGNIVRLVFFDIDRCNILIDIFSKNCLQDNQVLCTTCNLNDTDIINVSIAI